MRADITVVSPAGDCADYRLDGPGDISMADVDDALGAAGIAVGPTAAAGPHPEHGAVLGAVAEPEETAGFTLQVLGGIDAGATLAFGSGVSSIGRGCDATHRLHDPELSRLHFEIHVGPRQVAIREHQVTHRGCLNGKPIEGSQPLRAGDRITIGTTVLGWGEPSTPLAPPLERVEFPAEQPSRSRSTLGIIALVLPAVATVGVLGFTRSGPMLALTIVTSLAMIIAVLFGGAPRGGRRARREFAAAWRSAERSLELACSREQSDRRNADPGPGQSVDRPPSAPGSEMRVRLGLGQVQARLTVARSPGEESHPQLVDVPVCIDLPRRGLALLAPAELARAQARWLLLQLVNARTPAELAVVLSLDGASEHAWRWARWLPHLRGVGGLGQPASASARPPRPGQRVVVVHDARAPAAESADIAIGAAAAESTLGSTDDTGVRQILVRAGLPSLQFAADTISVEVAEIWARRLARQAEVDTPDLGVHLFDLLELPEEVTPRAIVTSWRGDSNTVRVPLGRGRAGTMWFDLDVDGPHALIGGTTGSGKSQLLRTLVLGLAARYPPSAVQFLLVDYKGGAAFGSCSGLPHVSGVLTDLDSSLTARALRSLSAELRRRERRFQEAGIAEFGQWPGRTAGAMPRLLVIVDEFATLAAEQPDFITGLVGIAQRGRSLGMHLLLATQRPGGSVSADIRANANLRIALRTISAAESIDLIDCADAAALDPAAPGHAIRAGTPPEQFQVAHLGTERAPSAVRVRRLDQWRRPVLAEAGRQFSPDADTLVTAIVEATAESGCLVPASPWQPPLPSDVPLAALPGSAADVGRIAIGLIDLPDEQRQAVFALDLGTGATVVLAGGPRSGRTSALLTVAAAASAGRLPPELHVHALDFAGGGLSGLRALPHVGTVATASQPIGVAAALIARLRTVARRRHDGDSGPAVLLLIDGWSALTSALDAHDLGASSARLREIAELGRVARISLIASGNRGVLSSALSAVADERLVLARADSAEYQLAGIATRDIPEELPPGRCLRGRDAAHIQLARPPGEWTAEADPDPTAIRVLALPTAPRTAQRPRRAGSVCLGLGGDSVEPVWLERTHHPRLLIAGAARSGKTALLCGVLEQLDHDRAWVAAGSDSRLRRVAEALGHRLLDPDDVPDWGAREPLVIDDIDELADTPLGHALTERAAAASPQTMIVAASTDRLASAFRGPAGAAKRWRRGILLQPSLLDGELLGIRLDRTELGGTVGRGIATGDAAWGWPTSAINEDRTPIQTWAPEHR